MKQWWTMLAAVALAVTVSAPSARAGSIDTPAPVADGQTGSVLNTVAYESPQAAAVPAAAVPSATTQTWCYGLRWSSTAQFGRVKNCWPRPVWLVIDNGTTFTYFATCVAPGSYIGVDRATTRSGHLLPYGNNAQECPTSEIGKSYPGMGGDKVAWGSQTFP